jgi:hypothetical protein
LNEDLFFGDAELFSNRETPAAATLAGTEGFAAAARRAIVRSGIFSALLN